MLHVKSNSYQIIQNINDFNMRLRSTSHCIYIKQLSFKAYKAPLKVTYEHFKYIMKPA